MTTRCRKKRQRGSWIPGPSGAFSMAGASWPSSYCRRHSRVVGVHEEHGYLWPDDGDHSREGREGRRHREHGARGHQASGKLIVGVNVPYTPNEFKDPSGKIIGFDVDLMNAIASTLGLTPRVPRGRLRQNHPGDPGRHLQRRHVVVHRHQGARAAGRLRHLLLSRLAVGPAEGLGHRPRQRLRQEGRGAGHHDSGGRRTAGQEQDLHRRG